MRDVAATVPWSFMKAANRSAIFARLFAATLTNSTAKTFLSKNVSQPGLQTNVFCLFRMYAKIGHGSKKDISKTAHLKNMKESCGS